MSIRPSNINILSNTGQIVATAATFNPITTLALAPASMVLTIGKILTDAKNGEQISPGDILSVTGNAVAIIGAVGAFTVGAPVAIPGLIISAGLGILGVGINQGWFNEPADYNNLHRSGQIRTYYDPLALDLDGDGLETVGTNRFSGSLFDHNRDGIRTATGWVAADDGFLVYDRNGNGMIDHGGELFGDNTLLADGSRAAHGYAALAELDADGNGKVDAADQAFSSLRVWRDLNQDGISQGGELFALADVGVQALNLAHTTPNTHLGNGNFLAQSSSYTKTDGTTAQMGDLDLAADLLFSRHSETVELTDEQRQAPNLQGMGRVRDLREAAALSGSLSAVLTAYAAADTKAEQAVNDDVWEWGFKVA